MHTLAPFKLDIQYRPGEVNVVADALSRPPEISLIAVATPNDDTLKAIKGGYAGDPYFAAILEQLTLDRIPRTAEKFTLREGLLYLDDDDGTPRLCVPELPEIRKSLLRELHAVPTAGHPGLTRPTTWSLSIFSRSCLGTQRRTLPLTRWVVNFSAATLVVLTSKVVSISRPPL